MAVGMLNPEWAQKRSSRTFEQAQEPMMRACNYGAAGLIVAVLLAYLGAWIAM
jgi:hypothetical protein